MPKRIQRKRTRGWRMPENCVYVGRPTKWGNPVKLGKRVDRDTAMWSFTVLLLPLVAHGTLDLSELRGKDLCCWCSLDQPCHADVLLELANK